MSNLPTLPSFVVELLSEQKGNVISGSFMGEGRRNVDLTRLAGSLRRIASLDQDDLAAVLLVVNSRQQKPLPDSEVHNIARSVAKYDACPIDLIDEVHLSKTLAEEISDTFRYCAGVGWLGYSDGHWQVDTGGKHVQERVKMFLTMLFNASKAGGLAANADRVKAIKSHLRAAKVNSLILLASSDPAVLIQHRQFDCNRDLLNLRNGTVEFGSGKIVFREHRAEDYLTKIADVDCDPKATAPHFRKLLSEVLDLELRDFVMRFFGYVLTGYADQRVFAIFYGMGANGKSTVVNVVQKIMGDYSVNVEPATFLQARNGQVRGDLARLKDARMAVSSEFGVGQVMDGPLMKQLVGGDVMTARHLYQSEFEFRPTVVPLFVSNALPVINGADGALAARIIVVPFTKTIPPDARDPMLASKLWNERSGILNMLLDGMLDYLSDLDLRRPKIVTEAVEDYVKASDLLALFIEDNCEMVPSGTVGAKDLYEAYRYWCFGHGVKSMTQPVFKTEISKKDGMRQVRTSAGLHWTGVTLKKNPMG